MSSDGSLEILVNTLSEQSRVVATLDWTVADVIAAVIEMQHLSSQEYRLATTTGKHLESSMKLSTLSEKVQSSSSGTVSALMVARIKCGRCGGTGTVTGTCGSC